MTEPPLHGDINRLHDGGSRMVVTRSGRLVAAEELQRRRAEIEDVRSRRLARTMKRLFRKAAGAAAPAKSAGDALTGETISHLYASLSGVLR